MLKTILQIFLLFLILKLLYPLFKGMGGALRKLFMPPSGGSQGGKVEKEPDYSKLTPYDIEDADYEEVKKDGE